MNFLLLDSKFGEFFANLFSIKFTLFDMTINIGNLAGSVEKMMGLGFSQEGDYATLWGLGTSLFNILVPVATSLLTLFFLMDLFGLLRDVNQVSWERVVMKGIKFWAVYAAIVNLPYLLTTIIGIINDIYKQKSLLKVKDIEVKTLSEAIKTGFNNMSLWNKIFGGIMMVFMFGAYIGTAVAVIVACLQRFIKLILLYGISPIPVCMLTFGATQQAGKRFFQNFAATLMQALLVIVLIQVYKLGLSSLSSAEIGGLITCGNKEITVLGYGIGLSVCNALLSGGISLASSISNEAFGATAF